MVNPIKALRELPSPAHYQTLERELAPVTKYLKGHVLNAGCGERNINNFLLEYGALSVENCDVKSSIPNAIICDLTQIPRPANTYDAVLCNAVLEHVQFPDSVMKELRRILKPKGFLVLTVPFLQPYHLSPTDYQRYTKDGLLELGRSHDFEFITIFPVHSIAQTITTILWSWFDEKKRRILKLIFLIPFYLWCKISEKTDFSLMNSANAYQAVFRKNQKKEI